MVVVRRELKPERDFLPNDEDSSLCVDESMTVVWKKDRQGWAAQSS